jgi:hypothetical protein
MLRRRLILLVPVLALFAFVATTEERAEAADTTPPETTITSGPSGSVSGTTATFEFISNEAGSTFKCKLVGQDSTRTTCTSGKTYTNLTAGTTYTFKVWATDAAGNIDPTPATRTFTPSGGGGGGGGGGWPPSDCEEEIGLGDDLDAIINGDPSGTATTFCVDAGTYTVSTEARLRAGDKLKGQPGTTTNVGTATAPDPVVFLEGTSGDNILRADGPGISITWVDLTGARGTGNGTGAIAAGSAGSDFLVQFARIHNNASLGISNMKGTVLDSEFFSNSEAVSSLGFNASAVKGITEFEAGRLYVHDEQGNGIWCDGGCSNDPARENGFWVYDSVVEGGVEGGGAGIRYENSPNQALIGGEDDGNLVQGWGRNVHRGNIDIRDSQHADVVDNILRDNANRIGIRATDSGRSDRVNLADILVANNNLNGLRIIGCELGGTVVECSGNVNVGSR